MTTLQTFQQIAEQYTWGSPGFVREISTHLGDALDVSREEIERIASRSTTPEEFMAIVAANAALDQWEPDEADEAEIADVFWAIFGRAPDATDDPVSDIYAAKSVLDASEAERVNKVLG